MWRPLVGLAAEVRAVGVPGDDPQRELLAAAADPDRRVGPLHRLRIAVGPAQLVVLAVVGGLRAGSTSTVTISTVSRSMPMRSLADGNS